MGIQIIEDAATWKARKDKDKFKKYWKALWAVISLVFLAMSFKCEDGKGWFIGFVICALKSK